MAATTYFNRFPSYCKMVSHAKNLAKRSILIDHCGIEHIDLGSDFKNVEQVYSIERETKRGFSKLSLIEFRSMEDANNVMRSARHIEGLLPVPLKILRYNGRISREPNQNLPFPVENVRLSCDRETSPMFQSYTDLISNNMMSLVALKLRFVTLVNFEQILCSGSFNEFELMPFGSSVIDMGCDSGDLDLIMTRRIDHHQEILEAPNRPRKALKLHDHNSQQVSQSTNLIHLDKSLYSEAKDNSGLRATMRWFDNVLREYMPLTDGFGILSLHRARVPIIKFTSRVTNIDCDLSFDLGMNYREPELTCPVHPGIMMTEILYALCRNNNLITALVIYLRIFAKLNSITSKLPGVGMTNFQFLSLVIFFLQQTSITIEDISSSRHEKHQKTSEISSSGSSTNQRNNKFIVKTVQQPSKAKDQIRGSPPLIPPFKLINNGEFLRDGSTLSVQHHNDEELNQILPQLIVNFFDFYSNFDFNCALNLYESRRDKKLDNSSLYVLNPLETTRNICHNVSRKSLDHLIKQVRKASSNEKKLSVDEAPAKLKDLEYQQASPPTSCPLSMIKIPLLKQQRQAKRSRTILYDDSATNNHITPEGIAQEICN